VGRLSWFKALPSALKILFVYVCISLALSLLILLRFWTGSVYIKWANAVLFSLTYFVLPAAAFFWFFRFLPIRKGARRRQLVKAYSVAMVAGFFYLLLILLPAPCQVEVVEFSDPFRLVLLFFFDQAKPDLEISFHKIGWDRQRALGAELAAEYGVRLDPLLRIFQGCRDMDPATNYAIDGSQNLLAISFPKDPRSNEWPLAKALNHDSSPETIAETIFHLNVSPVTILM